MSKRSWILAVVVVLVIVGVGIGLLALFRIEQAREFSAPHQVRRGGTNYVVRLREAVVGKADIGYVLMVYVQLENPNSFDVALPRRVFLLVDHHRRYYAPSISGTQGELIKLPAGGVLRREMLSFTIPENALGGRLMLVAGQNYAVLVKDRTPFTAHLRDGEFQSFRRQGW
ncbi:MAG TPA: hypothetical protein VL486_15970 [Verrucomicrobiae bacterium]|nr:hypothetical protein [Verrucomicrobiae bacterium]